MNSRHPFLTTVLVALPALIIVGCTSTQMEAALGEITSMQDAAKKSESQPEPESTAEPVEEEPTSMGPKEITPEEPWDVNLGSLNGDVGDQFILNLPPGGEPRAVWGTYEYTGDSSIGTAAVHSGLITFAEGGTIVIEILEGRQYYIGSKMNGVSSSNYGRWGSCFTFLDNDERRLFPEEYNTISWGTSADIFPEGEPVTLTLPPGGRGHTVWGTDIYTADSSIGTAAVHAGLITFQEGGEVTIRRIDGLDQYQSSERNGVRTSSYGRWGSAFEFVR